MRKLMLLALSLFPLSISSALAQTQTATLPDPQRVEITATDGLKLVGDFYTAEEEGESPAVLLLHMLGSNRQAWETFIPALLDDGYNALAVDLRGDGESGRRRDWALALDDTLLWLGWLRQQPSVKEDSVSIIGASIGTPLALAGCAADQQCVTAILLSPVAIQLGLTEAISEGMAERSVLMIASQSDRASANALRWLIADATGEIGVHLFHGNTHGTNYLTPGSTSREQVTAIILDWLNTHLPIVEG